MQELDIFTNALTYADPAERIRFLDEVCQSNVKLRKRIDDLLECHRLSGSVLDRQPVELVVSPEFQDDIAESFAEPVETVALRQLQPHLEASDYPGSLGRLGRYELLQILGQGGYGIVAKAVDTKLERRVAIKVLAPHLAVTSSPRKRFLREARAAAAVTHEHVVQTYAVEDAPLPHLVAEFIAGETLQQRLNRLGPFDAADVARIGRQIALGLAAAHQQGLVHRDIKPANILLQEGVEAQAKLTDFGLAQAADDASLTQSGVIAGTPQYMSPEQVSGQNLDLRADLFSLGSVLYVMTVGHPPFRAPNTLAILKRVAEDTPRPIRQMIPETPRGLCDVISKLHEKSKERRYASAQEVADALATCLIDQPRGWSFWSVAKRRGAVAIVLFIVATVGVLAGISPFNKTQAVALSNSAAVSQPELQKAEPQQDSSATSSESADSNPQTEQVATVTTSQPGLSLPEVINPELTEWDRALIAMSVDEQQSEFRKKLVELNPELPESAIRLTLTDGKITNCVIDPSQHLSNLAPLRALRDLEGLRLDAGGHVEDLRPLSTLKLKRLVINSHPIRDLTPLAKLPLIEIALWHWPGDDISPLRGMKLKYANVGISNVSDISALRGMPLTGLCLNYSKVEDLSPLEGMPLTHLEIQHTRVWNLHPITKAPLEYLWTEGSLVVDYDPIKNMPSLTHITLNYDAERDNGVLRTLKLLQNVNGKPVYEVVK